MFNDTTWSTEGKRGKKRERERESESETEKRKSSNVSCRRLKGYGKGGSERAKRERARERRRRARVTHHRANKRGKTPPRSQFGAAKAEDDEEAWKGRPVSRGCITFRRASFTTF